MSIDVEELARLKAEARGMSRLHALTMRLAETPDLREAMLAVLETAVETQDAQFGLVSLNDPSKGFLHVWASIGFDQDALDAVSVVVPGAGACGRSFATKARVVVEDTEADPLFIPFRDVARRVGFRAVHSTPIVTRAGEILGVLSVHYARPTRPSDRDQALADMCARHGADVLETARDHERLREAERRKDTFLATLAHELRNSLAPIVSAVHLMAASDDRAHWERARAVIDRQAKQLVRLVDDLLDVSRITTGKLQIQRQLLDLRDVVHSAVETARPHIEAGSHRLELSLPDHAVYVNGDPIRLSQILTNLLNNAARYSESSGFIAVEMRPSADQVEVAVTDTGIGIVPDRLQQIFEPFTQGSGHPHAGTAGLGVGLALAKRLVEMHDGQVSAHSEGPGTGSRFLIRLPLASAARTESRAERPQPHEGRRRRVLVVDDNADAADMLAELLRKDGHSVHAAYDGGSALAMLEVLTPDLVLLDLGMPAVSGYDVIRQIRADARFAAIQVVALTGWGQLEDRDRTRRAGFDGHLVKPVSSVDLDHLLQTLPASAAVGS